MARPELKSSARRRALVSVLMPVYNQASFLPRAFESLRAQTLSDWEAVVVDDGSTDATAEVLAGYGADGRVRVECLGRNRGLGAALNVATALAGGKYLAYLPADDAYFPGHLEALCELLEGRPDVYLAYAGVQWHELMPDRSDLERPRRLAAWRSFEAPTLLGACCAGAEPEALEALRAAPIEGPSGQPQGNLLTLAQIMHRRGLEAEVLWATREQGDTGLLLPDFWRGLSAKGARFAFAGGVGAEWSRHPPQRSEFFATTYTGVSGYRQHYGVRSGEALLWVGDGLRADERAAAASLRVKPAKGPARAPMSILLVGELGFNPERILAFEERGHTLHGLWLPNPEFWDCAGPLAFGNVNDISFRPGWQGAVERAQPDVIYALLNWSALPLIQHVLDADLGVPLVFHFKEGPFHCQQRGLWPALVDVLGRSDGQVYINEECFDWLQFATGGRLDPATAFLLDGDLPRLQWMTDDWSPKLSDADGEIHTVCPGRLMGLGPNTRAGERRLRALLEAGVHVHLYGRFLSAAQAAGAEKKFASARGRLHCHPGVGPAQWVRELSKYDAGWSHLVESDNGGDIARMTWSDLNYPARLGTLAAAGLPWVVRENPGSRVAVNAAAARHDIGVFFRDPAELAEKLRDRARMAKLSENARKARAAFSFDGHVDNLLDFFAQTIARRRRPRAPRPRRSAAPEAALARGARRGPSP